MERVEEGSLDFFSFDVHFAHVVSAGGFDVVAGNPPWVRNSRIEPRAKEMYIERYALLRAGTGERPAFHQPDLSLAFIERAVSLAAPDGVVAMLMPAKIANAGYAASLRRFAQEELSIIALDDWSDEARRYFDADTFPLGLVVRRGGPVVTRVTACGQTFELDQSDLPVSHAGSEWALVPPVVAAILHRLRRT